MKQRRQYQSMAVGKKCLTVIYGLIAVTLVLICLLQAFSPYKDMWFGSGKCSVWDMGWIYEREDGTDIRVSLPMQLDVEKADRVRLHNTIPSSYGLDRYFAFAVPCRILRWKLMGKNLPNIQIKIIDCLEACLPVPGCLYSFRLTAQGKRSPL